VLRGLDTVIVDEADSVLIVDEFTGRMAPQRSWGQGLHQAIEAGQGVELSAPNETLLRLSFQRFIRLFRCRSGMSGTVAEGAEELWRIYRLPVFPIPENRPCRRQLRAPRLYADAVGKWRAIVAEVDPARIALWGTSFGGANAIIAASGDARVRCLLVQLAFGDGERVITGQMDEQAKQGLLTLLQRMQERKAKSGKEKWVAISKVLGDPQSQQFYESHVERFPALRTKIPFLTLAETIAENY